MEQITAFLIRRLRPRIGWWRALLGLVAVLCLAAAANANALDPPSTPFVWGGLLGFLVAMRLAPSRGSSSLFRPLLLALLVALGAVMSVLAIGQALPPLDLVVRDIAAWYSWVARMWNESTISVPLPSIPVPAGFTQGFFAEAIPRFWNELRTAPDRGEIGASLLVAVVGSCITWLAAAMAGWGLQRGRWLLAWLLPLLVGLLLLTIFGGQGSWLVVGLALTMVLLVSENYAHAARRWEQATTDYSPEVQQDLLVWGIGLIVVLLMVSVVGPSWFENPLAQLVWGNTAPPSGLAALEPQAVPAAPRTAPTVSIGLSSLPALRFGVSLQQGSGEQVALRITATPPLTNTTIPRYWRARVYNIYNGSGWTTNARVRDEAALALGDTIPSGLIVQQIEDDRADPQLLVGLGEIVGVDVQTQAERLADGTLTALTPNSDVRRYRIISHLPEPSIPAANPATEPPDMSAFLRLPRLPARVIETAKALTNQAANDQERALALEAYLRELPYSYEVAPLPQSGDAVDQFLFDMRQGYCTYYASAMAVMARSIGIPSRLVSGYATGDYDLATDTYTVREQQAHAWPELYIDGRWLAFEPTPILPLPARERPNQPTIPTAPVPQPAPDPVRGPLIWLAVLVVFAALGWLGWWFSGRSNRSTFAAHIQLEALGRRLGVAWPAGATLHEYGALLATRLDGVGQPLRTLIDLIARARYAGRKLDTSEERQLEQAWHDVDHRAREQRR